MIEDGRAHPPVWIEIDGLSLDSPLVWDGFLFGLLLRLMEIGQPVHIEGAISQQALRNAIELQDVWALWCPDRYQRVAIEADRVFDLPIESGPVINAFSGGADSLFSLLRHRLKWLGPASRNVGGALLVHGFDVPLSDRHGFEKLVARCTPLLQQLQIPLYIARTNFRSANQIWEHSFATQLACCLHQFSSDYSAGVIGSSAPYDNQIFPWGSTPMTDHLLSGAFTIVHDGAGYSRTAKFETIKDHELALQTLKVCWSGPRPEENCGHCEKCIRTRLNLLVVGVSDPPCFEGPLDLNAVRSLAIRNPAIAAELRSILRYVHKQGITGEWVNVLRSRLKRYEFTSRFSSLKERIRELTGDGLAWKTARRLKKLAMHFQKRNVVQPQ